jgi:hypothetical protein
LSEDLLTVDIFNFFRKKEDRCGGCREMTVPFTVTVLPPGPDLLLTLNWEDVVKYLKKRENTFKGKKIWVRNEKNIKIFEFL